MRSSSTVLSVAVTICATLLLCVLVFFAHKSSHVRSSFSSRRRLQAVSVPQEAPKQRSATSTPLTADTNAAVPQMAPTGGKGLETAMVTSKFAAGKLEGAESDRGYKEIKDTHFPNLISSALAHKRGRKMNDLTKDPSTNSLQTLLNTWTDGSYSPVHKHLEYAESFTALDGALAFFTFTEAGDPTCHILHDGKSGGTARAIVIEKNEWHAMCAAPKSLGYPGHAIVFETSGHFYNASAATKVLASFAPHDAEGVDGDKAYFTSILQKCPAAQK